MGWCYLHVPTMDQYIIKINCTLSRLGNTELVFILRVSFKNGLFLWDRWFGVGVFDFVTMFVNGGILLSLGVIANEIWILIGRKL